MVRLLFLLLYKHLTLSRSVRERDHGIKYLLDLTSDVVQLRSCLGTFRSAHLQCWRRRRHFVRLFHCSFESRLRIELVSWRADDML